FDDDNYLHVNEYSFREYVWNNDSKTSEEIYIRGLSDYFFKEEYARAAVIFNSALKIYKKDARIYTRLAECYARLGDYNMALSVLNTGANEIFGFDALPGIISYRRELNDKLNESLETAAVEKSNIFIRILTFPKKLWPF
ncbi:tetratricopeptide repeat protein, partial [candidate division KSB1 bacterium]